MGMEYKGQSSEQRFPAPAQGNQGIQGPIHVP